MKLAERFAAGFLDFARHDDVMDRDEIAPGHA
jgi:hypothetical protein